MPRSLRLAPLAALGLVLFAAPTAHAQVIVAPFGYVESPLTGAANLVRALGDLPTQMAQARIKRVEARRTELEQFRWELDYRAEYKKRANEIHREERLDYYRNDAPQTEVVSGAALNVLLEDLLKHLEVMAQGQSTPVNPDWLKKIAIVSPRGGHLGVIKKGKLDWPLLLQLPQFEAERKEIDQLIAIAIRDLMGSGKQTVLLLKLKQKVVSLEDHLSDESRRSGRDAAWGLGSHFEARFFLRQLAESLVALEDADAQFYLKTPEGQTVAELVRYMQKNGNLRFAPAARGSDRAYSALYLALVEESRRVTASPGNGPRR